MVYYAILSKNMFLNGLFPEFVSGYESIYKFKTWIFDIWNFGIGQFDTCHFGISVSLTSVTLSTVP